MTRTQIQLPDDVFRRARKVCESREISLAELARRGLEYMLTVYDREPGAYGEWKLPKPRRLGWKGLTDSQIKEQAQLTTAQLAIMGRRKK